MYERLLVADMSKIENRLVSNMTATIVPQSADKPTEQQRQEKG
ncbi:hypothetical protein [Leptolyngbya sp. FACHB-671]|nr:hypothetical protein [Leptolyngbya sp. FACHB-671]